MPKAASNALDTATACYRSIATGRLPVGREQSPLCVDSVEKVEN
jgi:hypothetical protein